MMAVEENEEEEMHIGAARAAPSRPSLAALPATVSLPSSSASSSSSSESAPLSLRSSSSSSVGLSPHLQSFLPRAASGERIQVDGEHRNAISTTVESADQVSFHLQMVSL